MRIYTRKYLYERIAASFQHTQLVCLTLFCERLLFITKTVECKGRLAAKPYDPKRLMSCQQQWCLDDIISVSIIVIIAMVSTDDLNLVSFTEPSSSRPNYDFLL